MLEGGVGGQNGVVRLDDGGRHLRGRVDGELELGLLTVVVGKSLKKERTETGTGSTTKRVEDEESLETGTVVRQSSDLVNNGVNQLLTDGVVTSGVVVGSVLLTVDESFGVEEGSVLAVLDLVNDVGLQIDVEGSRNVLAGTGLGEEGGEPVVGLLGLVDDSSIGLFIRK